MNEVVPSWLGLTAIVAALASSLLIWAMHPLFIRYAMARPNARSSHQAPTPQGGGLPVLLGTLASCVGWALLAPTAFPVWSFAVVFGCAGALAALGVTDDVRPLEALPRLAVQTLVAVILVSMLPASLRIVDMLPLIAERALLVVGLIWLVNLVNFMDGIDWMTVAEVTPVTAALAAFGLADALPPDATVVAFALCGAMLGFAPFNRPVAKLFLGDVGSLPIGLILGWLLILLAEHHLVAALLLPLYYLADATVTLLRRLRNGENVMQAHRSHFYQRAMIGGMSVIRIVACVFVTNLVLIGLATATLIVTSLAFQLWALAIGIAVVAGLLTLFSRQQPA